MFHYKFYTHNLIFNFKLISSWGSKKKIHRMQKWKKVLNKNMKIVSGFGESC